MAAVTSAGHGLSPEFGFTFSDLGAKGWTQAPVAGAPASTAELSFDRGEYKMVLAGAFTLGAGGAVTGTLSGITVYDGASVVYRIAGFAPQDAAPFIDYVLNQHYTVELRDGIFAGNDTLTGSALIDEIYTGAGNDHIGAGAGNDNIDAGAGSDTVDGGDGFDNAVASAPLSDFLIERSGTTFTLTSLKDGSVDTYLNVERISYGTKFIATDVDVDNVGGQVFRMYQAALDRVPDQLGLPFWTEHLGNKDLTLVEMANEFIHSWEYGQVYGSGLSNHDLVARYYENVLHRAPDQGGLDYWTALLDSGHATNAQVLAAISESPENIENSAAVLAHGAVINYSWPL